MRAKHYSQRYITAKIYNNKEYLGSSRGSGQPRKSKRQVVLEYSMGLLSGLLHDAKPFTLSYRAVQRKVMVHVT